MVIIISLMGKSLSLNLGFQLLRQMCALEFISLDYIIMHIDYYN